MFQHYLTFFPQSVKESTIEEYKKATKKDIEVIIDEQNFLGQDW
jgi:hypothetical protein